MKHKDYIEKLSLYLEESLPAEDQLELENQLENSDELRKELAEMKQFFTVLDNDTLETPSANLKQNFDKMLAQEIAKQEPKVIQLNQKSDWKSYLRIAASVVIVVSAFLLGKYQPNTKQPKENTAQVLALLEDNSASTRIAAVTSAEEFSTQNTKILEALINRLFFDKNTNVRLAAAEALSKFSSETIVRDAFIKSLETDKNATVQIEIIQILSAIQEKRAIQTMENLLKKEETPQYVKQQLKLNLSTLL